MKTQDVTFVECCHKMESNTNRKIYSTEILTLMTSVSTLKYKQGVRKEIINATVGINAIENKKNRVNQ